jgi:hypothetical protein
VKLILPLRLALLVMALNPATADAQAFRVPRVEVGGAGGLLIAVAEEPLHPMFGPRLTFNISQRDAVELAADTLTAGRFGTFGLYFLQYKRTGQRPPGARGIRPFVTVGTGGTYTYRKAPGRRESRPDGSVVVYPASLSGELNGLSIASFGGGFERAVNRHASFRIEGSGFMGVGDEGFLAFRMLAGVSVPIGGYRANSIE